MMLYTAKFNLLYMIIDVFICTHAFFLGIQQHGADTDHVKVLISQGQIV